MKGFYGRTDLAIEAKESFPEDQVEISGVRLEEETDDTGNIKLTTVEILNKKGAKVMNKPIGSYVTLEFKEGLLGMTETEHYLAVCIENTLKNMIAALEKKEKKTFRTFLFSGLGNRFATPDALGPFVLEKLSMNRHIKKEFGDNPSFGEKVFCGITPGVMAQTGMESSEILHGVIDQVKPDVLLVIDALATASIGRLCHTIQLTDTGISPGAGIGNNRNELNKEALGIPVIAIGVPTVVEAGTIVYEVLRDTLTKEGYQEKEIEQISGHFFHEKLSPLFVTPKEIDEQIRQIGLVLAKALQNFSGYAP